MAQAVRDSSNPSESCRPCIYSGTSGFWSLPCFDATTTSCLGVGARNLRHRIGESSSVRLMFFSLDTTKLQRLPRTISHKLDLPHSTSTHRRTKACSYPSTTGLHFASPADLGQPRPCSFFLSVPPIEKQNTLLDVRCSVVESTHLVSRWLLRMRLNSAHGYFELLFSSWSQWDEVTALSPPSLCAACSTITIYTPALLSRSLSRPNSSFRDASRRRGFVRSDGVGPQLTD